MAVGIYKPGQGYWTRVLTAVGLGVIALSGAFWCWQQLRAFPVPVSAWVMEVGAPSGEAAPGQTVELFSDAAGVTRIGSGVVESLGDGGRSLRLTAVAMQGQYDPRATEHVEVAGPADAPAPSFAASVTRRDAVPAFQIVYLQAGVATLIILAATAVIYWLTAVKVNFNEFLIAVDTEMRKVNWSTRREVVGSTWVVLTVCALLTAVIFVVDYGFASLFRLVGVLGG